MTCKSNCTCLTDELAKQVETEDAKEFRDYVRSYCHVIESDLVAEYRQGITWEQYNAVEMLGMVTGELSVAMDLATQGRRRSDDWEEDLGRSIREIAGSAILALMALAGDLEQVKKTNNN